MTKFYILKRDDNTRFTGALINQLLHSKRTSVTKDKTINQLLITKFHILKREDNWYSP